MLQGLSPCLVAVPELQSDSLRGGVSRGVMEDAAEASTGVQAAAAASAPPGMPSDCAIVSGRCTKLKTQRRAWLVRTTRFLGCRRACLMIIVLGQLQLPMSPLHIHN